MPRITIQLVDTLVIIHGTHAYYPGETEQWISVVGSEQLELLTSAKTIVLYISLAAAKQQRPEGMQTSLSPLGVIWLR